jgi:hypothetical protein
MNFKKIKEALFGNKKRKIITIIIIILLLLLISYVIVMAIISNNNKVPNDLNKPDMSIGQGVKGTPNKMTKQQILDMLKKKSLNTVDTIDPYAEFPNGNINTIGTMNFENKDKIPKTNDLNIVYQQGVLYYNNKEIAVTPLLAPGEYTTTIKLKDNLKNGSYKGDFVINYYMPENLNYISNSHHTINFTIK